MPHIALREDLPGIRSLFAFRLEVADPISDLAQILLHDAHTLSQADRELIATYVSHLNDCSYCQRSHERSQPYISVGTKRWWRWSTAIPNRRLSAKS